VCFSPRTLRKFAKPNDVVASSLPGLLTSNGHSMSSDAANDRSVNQRYSREAGPSIFHRLAPSPTKPF
jgi:hypothetical protein